jgi:hypothetical protein
MSLKTKDKNVVYQLFIFVSQGRPGVMIRSTLLDTVSVERTTLTLTLTLTFISSPVSPIYISLKCFSLIFFFAVSYSLKNLRSNAFRRIATIPTSPVLSTLWS